jgi:NitT/TauT family transport system substrate-binding protein
MKRTLGLAAVCCTLGLVVASCGSDDNTGAAPASTAATTAASVVATTAATTPAPSVTAAPTTTVAQSVAGCEHGFSDVDTLQRPLARCEPNSPAPVPLTERQTLTLGVLATKRENYSVVAEAIAKGEFEKENLDVKVVTASQADILTAINNGSIDAYLSAPDAAMMNADNQNFNLKWVLGWIRRNPDGQDGLWAQKGTTIENLKEFSTSSIGGGTIPMYLRLKAAGRSMKDVKFVNIQGGADALTALKNGAVQAAVVTDPDWLQAQADPNLTFLAPTRTEDFASSGLIYGNRLLNKDREVGEAFVRAWIRTVNTYLADNYKQDPAKVTELSKLLEVPEASLTKTPYLIFDWELSKGVTDLLQEILMQAGSLSYTTPLPEDKVVDRGFIEAATGHEYG